jgi:hypothetical protein
LKDISLLSPFVNPKSIEIPKVFHSFETGKPFCNCVVCQKDLQAPGEHYFVEKAFKNYSNGTKDVIFEYAICIECAMELRETLSKESVEKIDEFFDGKVNLIGRWKKLTSSENYDVEDWVHNCLVSDKSVKESSEYQIYAHCEGDRLLFSLMPYMIDGDVIQQAQELLSQKTRDELDGFMDKYLGPPPEIREILKDHSPVFIF